MDSRKTCGAGGPRLLAVMFVTAGRQVTGSDGTDVLRELGLPW